MYGELNFVGMIENGNKDLKIIWYFDKIRQLQLIFILEIPLIEVI